MPCQNFADTFISAVTQTRKLQVTGSFNVTKKSQKLHIPTNYGHVHIHV